MTITWGKCPSGDSPRRENIEESREQHTSINTVQLLDEEVEEEEEKEEVEEEEVQEEELEKEEVEEEEEVEEVEEEEEKACMFPAPILLEGSPPQT